ncbi:nitronate monooxygenase [Rhodococcus sp. NPDC058521]|uniref:nitronate monooxygenase n=1 Tax=Rhodococcus sp. NPDC058521 TaxID=3346536 RepID=UPI003647BBB1
MLFDFRTLDTPIVSAPMAGGPSTPGLAAAVSTAGGLGFLAAGYLTPDRLAEDIAGVRHFTGEPFGVNIFVPERVAVDADALRAYRDLISKRAEAYGADLPDTVEYTDDRYEAKIEVVVQQAVPVVSFTFGCPSADIVDRLHANDSCVVVTVTNAAEAAIAVDAGADALCVQGPGAGGHRATFHVADEPGKTPLVQLVTTISESVDIPIVAAGGVSSADDVRALIAHGAVAVQVGTMFLRTPEAGTKPAHRGALRDPDFAETIVTRAYSGRPARGLRNTFITEFGEFAPPAYPYVNTLTAPLRKAAANDPTTVNLWAGTGFAEAQAIPAAHVVAQLASGIHSTR